MKILIESMTKVSYGGFNIRCWREEDQYSKDVGVKSYDDIILRLDNSRPETKEQIARELLKVHRMNAVEVLDDGGDGCVFYSDWP